MSTTKTVNVTTGKVLHYTIKKTGYKPVSGSKLITGPETINVNMVPESSSDGVYVFGDRIGGCATFFGYFDSVDPNTQAAQKYACFVVDAQYRATGIGAPNYAGNIIPSTVTKYASISAALAATDSATYTTQAVLDAGNYNPYYRARNPDGQSLIVEVGGSYYEPQLPNAYELNQIRTFRTQLDTYDPTASSYADRTLSVWGANTSGDSNKYAWSASILSDSYYGTVYTRLNASGTWDTGNLLYSAPSLVFPIFEIPVN